MRQYIISLILSFQISFKNQLIMLPFASDKQVSIFILPQFIIYIFIFNY